MSGPRELAAAPPRARTTAALNSFWSELLGSLRNPEFWALSGWLDIVVRARKSRFGVLWLLAPSIIYVFGLGAFFATMQGRSFAQFAAHVALGAMVFRTLMSSVVESSNVFSARGSFIMDGHMRLTDYLLESLAKSFFQFCMFVPAAAVALMMFDGVSPLGFAWMPLSLVLMYINGLWITVVFSLVGARFPDFGQFIGNIAIFVFLLTPIIWYPDMMPPDSVRGQLMRFNPFYHFVSIFRAPFLGEPVETYSLVYVAVMTVAGLLVATLLYRRYARYVPLWI
ncbi:MAG: ABC transporter permease [Pseudomonadota bacterium]|nr:ABC transporter permease [Pseudomonadota bacterium]